MPTARTYCRAFGKACSVVIEGHKLLIFTDYSMAVSRKLKEFQLVCAELYKRRVHFTLAYPAILRLQVPYGEKLNFQSPEKVNGFLHSLSLSPRQTPSKTYAEKVKYGPREQRSPRKDPPKRLKHTSSFDQCAH